MSTYRVEHISKFLAKKIENISKFYMQMVYNLSTVGIILKQFAPL